MRLIALVVGLCTLLATAAFALTTPERTGRVTDQAGILDTGTAGAIAAQLDELQRQTGDEVVVVTLKSLEGVSIETWGNLLGENWRVGRSGGRDSGVLLIVAPNDRKVRIAVGYGLGNRISDQIAEAIIADHILPYFRQGDLAGGVKAGVNSILLQLDRQGGATTTTSQAQVERGAYPLQLQRPSFWQWLRAKLRPSHETKVIAVWVGIFVIVYILMVLNVWNVGSGSGRRGWYGYGRSSWGSSSGGFFSGGGGSSGGGSSSHGSFGGGATGSW